MPYALMLAEMSNLPIILTMVASFVAVTAVAFLVIGRISGGDKPTAEARLDIMKDPRRARDDMESKHREGKKGDALTAALEKAANPIGDRLAGSKEEMGKLREKLMNAGIRHESAPLFFKFIQMVLAAIGLLLGGVTGLVMDGLSQAMVMKLAIG